MSDAELANVYGGFGIVSAIMNTHVVLRIARTLVRLLIRR